MAQSVRLSKSRLIAFRQCPKRLWLEVNRPELRQETSQDRARFQTGYDVGDKARALFPGGHLIAPDNDLAKALTETAARIKGGGSEPLYEATFRHDDVLVRSDILVRRRKRFDLVEVKSSTKIKDYQYEDAAIQAWVVAGAGVPLAETYVAHVDSQWRYPGDGDYEGLLKQVPVSKETRQTGHQIPAWLDAARKTAAGVEPDVPMGKQCGDPFPCQFVGYCERLAGLATEYPVTILPDKAGKTLARKLYAEGYRDLRDVPAEKFGRSKFQVMHRASVSGDAHFDRAASKDIAAWAYPRFYLDFETIQFAVPIWAGTRPYQQIPFQWSCHIEKSAGQFEHAGFLDLTGENPSRAFAKSLIQHMGKRGAVVVYNATFEKRILTKLAAMLPDLEAPLLAIRERVVDLLPVTREYYYHPAMLGSWSIKAVLPTIAPDLAYDNLGEVQDGTAAQVAYAEAIAPATSPQRKAQIEHDLEIYCERDTWAMVRVTKVLAQG